ncbi:MAG TPA: tetratricopeptide repeat protein [Anaerolineaceae bacterium]|nr:tetratricopeptide repeat protein [Anaerolineaceae bacterium]
MEPLRLYLFGSLNLERNGQPVEMDTRKALALLAVLALAGGDQQRDALTALLYPEADPTNARAAFRRTLSTLNGATGEGVLSIRREAVGVVKGSGLWVDVLEFRRLVQEPAHLENLDRAASLYRGDFMAGFNLRDSPAFDEWQYQQAEELRQLMIGCLDRLSALTAAVKNYPHAIEYATRRIGLDPLLEESHRQLMTLYARAGQRSAALRQYRECVRILEQELGVSPLEETTRLYQEILSSSPVSTHMPQDQAPKSNEIELPRTTMPVPMEVKSTLSAWPLVGRDKELVKLLDALHSATAGLFISLEGEAGVGKTRLAAEIVAAARAEGRVVAQACCYEGESGLAYAPIMASLGALLSQPALVGRLEQLPPTVLAEAGRLLPGLVAYPRAVSPEALPESPAAQARFYEALRQLADCLLGGAQPGLLLIDDLHWADLATLDLLAYLARRSQPGSFHILVTWRSHEALHQERLRQLQAEQQRAGRGLYLALRRLTEPEIGALARLLLPGASETDLSKLETRLYQESEGLPFIALEYLRSLDAHAAGWELPKGVRDLLHQRLQIPGELSRQLLTAAAVIGRSFDFATLQAVSGRSELETIAGLEELDRLGLIREGRERDYDFTHEKLRQVTYEETSLARRRLLHLRTGEALAAAGHGSREAVAWAGLAAGHFLQAGQPGRAAELYRLAGDQARRLYANDEALSAYQAALAAGHPDPAELHEAIGDLYTLLGNYREAIASYQAAAAFCTPACLSSLMHKLGEIYQRRGEWDAAEGHYQAALDAAGENGSPAWLAHLYADWSLTAYRRSQLELARRLSDQSLQHARHAAGPGALAQALNIQGILSRAGGALDEASRYFQSSLEDANRTNDLRMRCAVLNNLARLLQERGRPAEAIPLAREALDLCIRIGDRHRQAAIQNNLADLYHQAGQDAQSLIELKQAVALFAEITQEGLQDYPEIWKMTEW